MTEPEEVQLPAYSTQLRDAYLYEVTLTRRDRIAEDDSTPSLNASLGVPLLAKDSTSFSQLIAANVFVPFNDGKAILEMRCVYNGVFASSGGPLSADDVKTLAERTTTVLLWPYLRAGMSEIARMTGVAIPRIPTLDVAGFLRQPLKSIAPKRPGVSTRRTRKTATKAAPAAKQ